MPLLTDIILLESYKKIYGMIDTIGRLNYLHYYPIYQKFHLVYLCVKIMNMTDINYNIMNCEFEKM